MYELNGEGCKGREPDVFVDCRVDFLIFDRESHIHEDNVGFGGLFEG